MCVYERILMVYVVARKVIFLLLPIYWHLQLIGLQDDWLDERGVLNVLHIIVITSFDPFCR